MTDKINIRGIAIRPGVSKNGIMYTKEELNNFAATMIGRPILKDHRGETDNTIGLVTHASTKGDGVVFYNGWVKEDGTGLVEKINDGRIKEVSVGAFAKRIVKENDDDEFCTAVGLEGMELSTTPIPAVRGTSFEQALASMKEGKGLPTIYENFDVQINTLKESTDLKDKILEEIQMEDKDKAPLQEAAPVAPVKAEAATVIEEKRTIKVDVDTSKLDEAISKAEKLGELRTKLSETEKSTEAKTKGKVVTEKTEVKEENKFVVEASELGTGYSFYSIPKSDGSLL